MNRLLALSLLAAPALVAQAPAPSLDQLIANHYQAMGGIEKFKAVKTVRMTMKMQGGPMEIPIEVEVKRPDKMRVDVSIQGMTITQGVDGAKGWKINPMGGYGGGKPEPEPMTPEEMKQAEQQRDWEGPLFDYKAKGHKVEYQGTEAVEGAPAHKLKLMHKNGDIYVIYLDADTFLQVKQKVTTKVRDQEQTAESFMSDYKAVDGLLMAHTIEIQAPGAPARMKMVIEKVTFNAAIDDARFKQPAAKPAEPAKASAAK